jgi:hypothetical protein
VLLCPLRVVPASSQSLFPSPKRTQVSSECTDAPAVSHLHGCGVLMDDFIHPHAAQLRPGWHPTLGVEAQKC